MTHRSPSSGARRRGLEAVGSLIDTVLSQVAHADVGPVMQLRRAWPDIAGRWAETTSPVRLSKGVLTVEVASGAVASKFRYAVSDVLEAARSAVGETHPIDDISIRVARVKSGPE